MDSTPCLLGVNDDLTWHRDGVSKGERDIFYL